MSKCCWGSGECRGRYLTDRVVQIRVRYRSEGCWVMADTIRSTTKRGGEERRCTMRRTGRVRQRGDFVVDVLDVQSWFTLITPHFFLPLTLLFRILAKGKLSACMNHKASHYEDEAHITMDALSNNDPLTSERTMNRSRLGLPVRLSLVTISVNS